MFPLSALLLTTAPFAVAATPFTGFVATRSDDLTQCAAAMNGVVPYGAPSDFTYSGNARKFYIAAEEELWNYVPTGWDNWLGLPISQSPRAQAASYLQFGTSWLKAFYRGYTDATFTKRSEQPSWQGSQGPTIRAEQNDMIEIMFVNKLQDNFASMHSMGLAYNKDNEGSDYPNTTYPNMPPQLPVTGAVPPGSCVVYKWLVNTPEGPNPPQPARTHAYHSFVSYREDSNTGLLGPTIIYAPGKMEQTMAENREFPLLYMIYNEADSWLSAQNKARLNSSSTSSTAATHPTATPQSNYTMWSSDHHSRSMSNESYWHPQLTNYNASGHFSAAPSFHTMNGWVFVNNPVFDMCLNDKVIWYVYAYGSASHVFHMHGNGFKSEGVNMDVIGLNDGVMKTLYMNATGGGEWQVLCHVANHLGKGMVSSYRVQTGNCTLPRLSG